LKDGKIKPIISGQFPLEQAQQAHELLESASVPGKIVLVCNQ
jgi:NADPH:quinone reductase-like Zn-dependent oxidoreductase